LAEPFALGRPDRLSPLALVAANLPASCDAFIIGWEGEFFNQVGSVMPDRPSSEGISSLDSRVPLPSLSLNQSVFARTPK
jgi:hypothetical protein